MAKRKDITYKRFQSYIKDKDTAVNHYIDNYLTKTQSMFVYENLPVTIPQSELEHLLQTTGNCFVTDVDGDLYALSGSTGGLLDAYNRPTQYIVANPALNLCKTYEIGMDGVLVKNDYYMNGLLPLIGKFAVLLTDSNISLNTAVILSRITMLISASDDKTKQSADSFMQKILDGDFSVIGESAFFDGVKLQTTPTSNSNQLMQLVEIIQYYKANLLNELGLNANFNMKRERLNRSEVSMNIDVLLPFVDNMLYERQQAVEAINEMFGTEITVDLHSSWKTTHEQNDELEQEVETPKGEDPKDETSDTDDTKDNPNPDDTTTPDDTPNPDDPDNTKSTDKLEATDETIEKSDTDKDKEDET